MKKRLLFLLFLTASVYAFAQTEDPNLTVKDGVAVVNTTALAKDVSGYAGPTPVLVYIKDGTILKVEALENAETAAYFDLVREELLDSWNGTKALKIGSTQVDAVSGATYSSRAIIANVQRGARYYNTWQKKQRNPSGPR